MGDDFQRAKGGDGENNGGVMAERMAVQGYRPCKV